MVVTGPLSRGWQPGDVATETPDTPVWARQVLRSRAFALEHLHWSDTELVLATERMRRRHEARQAADRAAKAAEADRLRLIADLPDTDLLWLISMGWRP